MKENSIRRAVREGRAALGTGLKEFASRGVPWIIEAAGFDYCAIDHEHGAFDMETIANLASWFQATNVLGHRSDPQVIRASNSRHSGSGHHGHPGVRGGNRRRGARDRSPGEVSADREPGHLRPGAAHAI